MSKFDIRRASKDQLDRMNLDIKNGKSGKNYTMHQSGGLDFILVETVVENEAETETHALEVEELSRHVEASLDETPNSGERTETCLEFNFEQ